MFGVAFELYQGSGVAGHVALARPFCCCRLWAVSAGPRRLPLAVVRLSPKLSERWVEIAIVRGPVGIHLAQALLANQNLCTSEALVYRCAPQKQESAIPLSIHEIFGELRHLTSSQA